MMTGDGDTPRWRIRLGLGLFVLSCLAWPGLAVLPMLDLSGAEAAAIGTGLLVAGEGLFLVSLAVLGKPFYESVKAKVLALFRLPAVVAPPSLGRHRAGVVFLVLSAVALYGGLASAFLPYAEPLLLWIVVAWLLASELTFWIGLWLLGPDAWRRLAAILAWTPPDAARVSRGTPGE